MNQKTCVSERFLRILECFLFYRCHTGVCRVSESTSYLTTASCERVVDQACLVGTDWILSDWIGIIYVIPAASLSCIKVCLSIEPCLEKAREHLKTSRLA